jgi:hypothetical protein
MHAYIPRAAMAMTGRRTAIRRTAAERFICESAIASYLVVEVSTLSKTEPADLLIMVFALEKSGNHLTKSDEPIYILTNRNCQLLLRMLSNSGNYGQQGDR